MLKRKRRRTPAAAASGARARRHVRKRSTARRPAGASPARAALLRRQYDEGREAGYREGLEAGIRGFGHQFEGTSIVIPTRDQLDYLRMCVDSIFERTDVPYEIIVIDNGSTDGTAEYLESLRGQIRYRVMDRNYGFAGAVNRGLMMAKGQHIVLLNNDTIVTDRWLENLLACLNSDERIGMVGPVTNYISGDQRIETHYDSIEAMHAFASAHNRSDPAKWQHTDRLTGFCLLFRRELWERTGYFDEGYEIGNFEDDDYNIRVRLQGHRLVIARDTFIHHFGSVSMKALGDRFEPVNGRNEAYYSAKWGNPHALIQDVRTYASLRQPEAAPMSEPPAAPGEDGFYPQYVAVQGVGPTVYWLARGERRPVVGPLSIPVARLSQVDLQRWPIGTPIASDEAEAVWRGVPDRPEADGALFGFAPDGSMVYIENGALRRVATPMAAEMWGFHAKPAAQLAPEQLPAAVGLPIIAPARLQQPL